MPTSFQWVLGDSFLVQVYTVYQYSPPAVGFARLPGQGAQNVTSTPTVGPSAGASNIGGPGAGGGSTQYPTFAPSQVPSGAVRKTASIGAVLLGFLVAMQV